MVFILELIGIYSYSFSSALSEGKGKKSVEYFLRYLSKNAADAESLQAFFVTLHGDPSLERTPHRENFLALYVIPEGEVSPVLISFGIDLVSNSATNSAGTGGAFTESVPRNGIPAQVWGAPLSRAGFTYS